MILDTLDGKHYSPTIILHDIENPNKPPILINFYQFLNSDRFKFIDQRDEQAVNNLFNK
jgi:hypothetical protein